MSVVLVSLAVILLLAAAGVQLALPRIAERRIGARLMEGGGAATVQVRAIPATRLLRNRGDLIEVRGHGLEVGLSHPEGGGPGLTALDGFDTVDIELVDFRTGPFAVAAFVLERSGGGSYAMGVRAQTTPAELATLGAESFASFPGGTLIGSVAGATPLGSRRIAVSLQIELISEPDGLRVGAGGGSIAGYPAGPLATTIAAAVARRLEIVP